MHHLIEMPIAFVIGATLAAQGQRVAAFKAWDDALSNYLKDGDVTAYRQQVSDARHMSPIGYLLSYHFSARQILRCSKHAAKR
jgi:hypothetical protein